MLVFNNKIYQLSILALFFIIISSAVQANNIKNSTVVFMYHKFGISTYPTTNITLDQFDKHLEEFSKPNYNVKSLDYILDIIINDGDLPDNTISISVDDADRSFLAAAWPRFKEKGFPVTLFVTTGTIVENNKNYLNWEEIRQLKAEGVKIGAHSHTHRHMSNYDMEELEKEIEKSNKIFLKEIGEIPNLYAYPYGETDEKIFDLLKKYKYKAAFGQHSGVVNETSNLYYLPRFSLNERYGKIDRVKFAASVKGLGVYDFVPTNPHITENPPYIGFSLLDQSLSKSLECFIFDSDGSVENEIFKFNERIEIRLLRKLKNGRSRLNCTARDKKNNWRWFGHQFLL
jgi:peptidoglycan/xylan/chitin deacetylase (PgdA/CDA1 family)